MSSDFNQTLRRLKPDRQRQRLKPRPQAELVFLDGSADRMPQSLLYDTTVYIDVLQGRFPERGEIMLRAAQAWHSTVAESELAMTCGLLDPGHPDTVAITSQIAEVIARIRPQRCLAPDREVWREAGVLAGILARTQAIARPDRRRILNDALIFVTARKHGHTVLTRNIVDFDFLQQLDPSGRVVYYRA